MARRSRLQSAQQPTQQPAQQQSPPPQSQAQAQAQAQDQVQADVQSQAATITTHRVARVTRNVIGPQSALTDFLASHNISARQIRDDAEQRRQRAAEQARQSGALITLDEQTETVAVVAESSTSGQAAAQADAAKTKKKKQEQKAIEKIKASKSFKKRKQHAGSDDDDEELARAIFEEHHAPLPGQMENCAICEKRFTVTPYSVAGPDGGLLCAPCGKQISKERQGLQPVKKKPRKQVGGVGSRRVVQSRMLDGDVGVKSLATLCVEMLGKNVDLADSLGDLPDHLIDKIAQLFSKRRLLEAKNLPLFVQPSSQTVHIYDGAPLGEQDFISIFQVATKLKHFKVRNAVQFKDEVMDYLLSRDIHLETFYLYGANLLSDEKWHEFLRARGESLKRLQVYYTDKHVGDETIAVIGKSCPGLRKLKIEHNQSVTDKGVREIANIPSLTHLGLQLQQSPASRSLAHVVSNIGLKLETLSFELVPKAEDNVLDAIRKSCRSLSKLRITDSEHMTDQGFSDLFTDWENPPLKFVDLQKCRHMDSRVPRLNPDNIGLCSEGFKALMKHSGHRLEYLNIHACRHISREAFEEVFSADKTYPWLRELEISFCEQVTDFVLGCIFRSCPKIKEVNVFGCMKVKEVMVPRGVILVGVPNAQGMVTEGVA